MSVPNQTPYNIYTANGLSTVFAYEFYLISASDIQVTINGSEVSSGYTVSGVGNTRGGEVTFLTAPANGATVIFERVTPTYRLTDYQDNGDLLADTVNKDFDRLWMAIQRAFIYLGVALTRPLFGGGPFNANGYRIANLAEPINDQDAATKKFVVENGETNLARTIRVPESNVAVLPNIPWRKNKILAFNDQGNPIAVLPESGSAADVLIELAALTGASLIGGLGFKTPEMRGALGNGIANDTAAIRDVMSVEGATVLLSHDYLCEPNITPAANVKIIGNGKIICTTGEEWIWSTSDRASPYPAFFITNPGVKIEGITIESTYEAVRADAGGDNLTLLFVKGGGTETSRAKSSAFVFFNVRKVRVFGIEGAYTGEVATWDAALSKIISGGCDGFDFGNVIDIYIFYSQFHDVGRNGINWYGASNVHIDHCTQRYCGQSGIQPGPHPNYSVAFISNNFAEYCCADSIDARYTGSDIVHIGLTMSDCESDWIGMLYGDVNYIGVDGTGTFTLARVKGVTATNFQARNFSGAAAWFDFASGVTASNIQGDSPYSRYGVGFYTSCSDIKLSNFDIKAKGTALWFGGSSSFTDFSIDGASKFESYDSYAVLMPNNPLTRFKISDTTFTGYKICNLIFEVDNVEFVHKGTDESALYLGTANLVHGKLKCTGTTSAVLVNVGVGTGVYISSLQAENKGAGDTTWLVASVNFKIDMARIWNTGSGGGAALRISGGQNNSTLDKLDLYSVSGRPLVSTATHTDLTLSLVRENGALASSWSDKSNVYRTSRALIS
ncbi:TPA: phage tail fiber protein [Klebsiella pneumoniae]